jgi:DNA-binding transcriptional regulator YdaS (Cro superfamily)
VATNNRRTPLNFGAWWYALSARWKNAACEALGVTQPHLTKIARATEVPSPELARKIHDYSRGAVSLHMMRPDMWDN